MFRQTCLVKACRTVGAVTFSWSKENAGGSDMDVRVLHNVGELSVLRYVYVLLSWSSNIDVISSRDASFSLKVSSDSCFHTLRSSHLPILRPRSSSYFLSSWVSCKNKMPTARPKTTTRAHTRFGRRNGNASKMVPRK